MSPAPPGTAQVRMESITQCSPGAPMVKSSPRKPSLPQRTLLRAAPDTLFRLDWGNPRSTTSCESAEKPGSESKTNSVGRQTRIWTLRSFSYTTICQLQPELAVAQRYHGKKFALPDTRHLVLPPVCSRAAMPDCGAGVALGAHPAARLAQSVYHHLHRRAAGIAILGIRARTDGGGGGRNRGH